MNMNKRKYGERESATMGQVPTVYNYIEYYDKSLIEPLYRFCHAATILRPVAQTLFMWFFFMEMELGVY
jgi:hypothetical protein